MTDSEFKGTFINSSLAKVVFGRGSISQLPSILSELNASKAFIITGSTLRNKTPVIKDVEKLLGNSHKGTFSGIGEHAPIQAIRDAVKQAKTADIDVFISIGGGSPIDSTKGIIHFLEKDIGKFLPHIAIPTTLSVAESTQTASYTTDEGHKINFPNPYLIPRIVIYDGDLTVYTPLRLWLSSGMRAVDHAVELLCHPSACEVPHRLLALGAVKELFEWLPKSKDHPDDVDIRQRLQLLALGTLFSILFKGGLGMSHSTGHALGASYHIPHGITSCLTLAPTVAYKARARPVEAQQLARLLPYLGGASSGSVERDTLLVSEKLQGLVDQLGLHSTLKEYKVPKTAEELEAIALRAVKEKSHPDYEAVIGLVKDLP